MPKSGLRLPQKLFLVKAIYVSDDKLYRESGNTPERLFNSTSKWFRLFIWATVFGISPSKLLYANKSCWREEKFPKEGGNLPLRWLLARESFSSFDKELSSEGICCTRLLY